MRRSLLKSAGATLSLAVILALLLPVVPSVRAFETLPSEISDEAFWKIVEDFSEEGGYFQSENFASNERGYQTLIPKLQTRVKPGGVYMGVGPEQNFQYIAGLRPKIAFIVDIRRQNMIQHLIYKAAFEMSSNRAEFLSILFSRRKPSGLNEYSTPQELFEAYLSVPQDPDLTELGRKAVKDRLIRVHRFRLTADDERTIDHVIDVFAVFGAGVSYSSNIDGRGFPSGRRGGNNVPYAEIMVLVDAEGVNRSYLASEESFRIVKDLERRNLLIPIVGNFGGPKAIRAVGQYLKDHDAVVSAFYLSNVEQYLFRPPQGGPSLFAAFYENVEALPLDSESTFIRSGNLSQLRGRGGGLTPMMSSIRNVLDAFREGRIASQLDVLLMSWN